MGLWAAMGAEELAGYRFDLITHESFPLPTADAPAAAALLVSNGRNHGLVFAESLGVEVHCEAVIRDPSSTELLGKVSTESGESVEVLNIDGLLEGSARGR
jgi:hypothetical protein